MASPPPELYQECARCTAALVPGALECGSCHALVHASRLEQLGASARLHEERREAVEASATWSRVLELLPPDSAQAEWVRGRIERLASAMANTQTVDARRAWIRKLGPLAPVAILLVNGKYLLALFKLKFLLSLAAFVTFYWALYGVKFGVGFAILILLHEMGHFVDIKRRGLPADMPVFLPGLGAYVRWRSLGVTQETRAAISLAGPLAGLVSAAACALIYFKTGNALGAGLARAGAWLNLMKLTPVWVIDGGHAASE